MDQCLVGKLSERVLEERVVGQLLALRFRLEAIDLLLRVREHEPAVHLLEQEGIRPWVALVLVPLLDHPPEGGLVLRLGQRDRVRSVVRKVEPDEVDLVAESRLDVLFVIEVRLILEGRAQRRERLGADRELLKKLVDLLPLVGAQVGVDRDEDRRGCRDDLCAAARSCLLLRAAAGDGERESDEQGDANQAHGAILFGGRPPAHEICSQFVEAAAVQDLADGVRDRHLDADPLRELAEHGRRRQALDRSDLRGGVRR